jgi:hypothetical protein
MPKPRKQELPVLAVDLGGTKIIAALISNNGEMLASETCPTLADEGPESVIKRIFAAIDHLLSLRNIDISQLYGISIAAAGVIDMGKGIITLSPNLLGWRDIPLRSIVQARYKINTDFTRRVLGTLPARRVPRIQLPRTARRTNPSPFACPKKSKAVSGLASAPSTRTT